MGLSRLWLVSCALCGVLLAAVRWSEGAAVPPGRGSNPQAGERSVFVPEPDANSFLHRRNKRSTWSELVAENRQRLAADERRKEYHEQLTEWENYVEEEQDEQYERNHERITSWRQWHYDGLYRPYQYNRYAY